MLGEGPNAPGPHAARPNAGTGTTTGEGTMRKRPCLVLGALLGALGLLLCTTAPARSQRPAAETLTQRLARAAKLSDEQAGQFWQALGKVVREELQRGRPVEV